MHELLTPEEAARADRFMVDAGTPIATLMDHAGYAVADALAAQAGFGVRIVVLAGPGDNGGDAFVAAEVLRQRGFAVCLVDMSGGKGGPAASAARAAWRGETVGPGDSALARADIIVDGLFGGGLSRPIEGEAAALVEAANAARAKIIAIDLPSGVNGATGAVEGPAIEAATTVTFERRKPGHLLLPGRAHAGIVRVAEIGISAKALQSTGCRTYENRPALWAAHAPRLAAAGHKYSRGHAVVVSGPMAATGAARLAATAALRAGAGLVTVASPADALMVNACHLTTVMLRRADGPDDLAALLSDLRLNTVCLGPGLPAGEGTAAMATAALASEAAVVLDAGALSSFAGAPERLAGAVSGPAVLTPHAGEFGRLFGHAVDKLADTRRAAALTGTVVIHKGADTVIAAPDGRAAINANAPPFLATAGTGDVLSGIVTSMLAQGLPPFEAAALAVWLHGEAAQIAGRGMIADDLLAALHPAATRLAEAVEGLSSAGEVA